MINLHTCKKHFTFAPVLIKRIDKFRFPFNQPNYSFNYEIQKRER